MANHIFSLSRSRSTAWPTVPCGELRSSGITPSRCSSGPSGHQNSDALPSTFTFMPSAIFAAMPHSPSQLDECGAMMKTSLGMSGRVPVTFQPPMRRVQRASQRRKALGLTCGICGGTAGSNEVGLFKQSLPVT